MTNAQHDALAAQRREAQRQRILAEQRRIDAQLAEECRQRYAQTVAKEQSNG